MHNFLALDTAEPSATAGIINKGLVLWGTKNIYSVLPCMQTTGEVDFSVKAIECRIKGKRGKENNERTFLIAGDYVHYTDTEEGYGMIVERIARKNSILRRKHDALHPIAVNIDILLIVASIASPPFRPRFIDRMIYVARCEKVAILLLLNKLDLCVDPERLVQSSLEEAKNRLPEAICTRIGTYTDIGLEVAYISVLKQWGIAVLRKSIANKNVAIVGQSGVGKSSIINCMLPEFERSVGEVSSKYNRGRHITTRPEFLHSAEYRIIDTPGIRELYPTHSDMTSLIEGYPDIFRFANQCKLPNCSHRSEPECGVRTHIGTEIHNDRYKSYLRLRESMESFEQKKWTRKKR